MKKAIIITIGIVLFQILTPSYFRICAQENKTKDVMVSGEASLKDSNKGAAKQKALASALRNAVEQGLGVLIDAESLVRNFQIIQDRIISRSRGYVNEYRILREGQFGQDYRVTIRASVSLKMIKDELQALSILQQQIHNPRVMIVIGTRDGTVAAAARSARIALEKAFAEQHFDLIDAETSNKLHNDIELLLEATIDNSVAAKIALDHHAEVMITGIIEYKPSNSIFSQYEKGKSTLILRIIDPTTARIFASTEESAIAMAKSNSEALSSSGRTVAQKVTKYAIQEIIRWWQEIAHMGTLYRITLKNVHNYPVSIKFEDAVRSIPNIISIRERAFGGGFLECDVTYRGDKSGLAKAIFKSLMDKPTFQNLNIEVGVGNNIIFSR